MKGRFVKWSFFNIYIYYLGAIVKPISAGDSISIGRLQKKMSLDTMSNLPTKKPRADSDQPKSLTEFQTSSGTPSPPPPPISKDESNNSVELMS